MKSVVFITNIDLIGNDSDFKGVLLEFSENIPKAPNEISQFLTNFKNSKIPNKEILFSATEKYPSISPNKLCEYFKKRIRDIFERYWWHGYSKIPQEKRIAKIKEQVNEEIKINPSFCDHRVSSEQNRKINEIAESLKSGKIIGKKIIANAFDLNARYCFITSDDLKNLKERLLIGIINAIKQKKRVALDHAHIDDIQYNVLDSAFYFIFDVGNPLLKKPSQLIVEVPREALDLENADRLVKDTLSPYNYSQSSFVYHISEGSYIIDLHLIDD
ncbi:hypothetical protein [Helicobacter pylori]|uniref:hypothetical protein n=1 Tax=Helicobacter pylori TaxID=210 RepID=UPI001E51D1EB|nr:hypothetical protein [Helicobacter pylori]